MPQAPAARRRRRLVATLALVVALVAEPAGVVPAPDAVAGAAPVAVPAVPEPAVPVEIGRTADTVTYANPDGTRTTHAHSRPLNYRTPAGQWRKIDPTIVKTAAGGFANVAGEVSVRFPAITGPDGFVTVSKPGWSVGWRLAGATVGRPGMARGSTIRYADVAGSADLEYGITAAGVKEVLVLEAPPTTPPTWRYPLRLEGVSATTAPDGSISFVDGAGVEVGHMPQGLAFDSANDDATARPAARTEVTLRLVGEPGGQAVEASVSREWLADPARVYPVRVDPSFNAGRDTPGGDAYMRSDQPGLNCNGNCQSDGGFDRKNKIGDHQGVEFVSVARFGIGPAQGKRIIAGHWNSLVYERIASTTGPINFSLWKVTDPWDENTVTWSTRPNHGPTAVLVDEAGGNWAMRDITGFVVDWAANPAANHGLIYDRGGAGGNFYSMAADEMGSVNPPQDAYISITWEEPAPTISGVSHAPEPAAPGDTVTFSVRWSDPGDTARAVICRTPGVANGTCTDPNGAWAIGAGFATANPATASVGVTQADVGRRDYWAYACDSHNACSPARTGTLTVTNPRPTATSASDDPDPVVAGATIRFAVGWTDPGDSTRAVICKTAAITADGSCADGAWARGPMGATSPARADYVTQTGDVSVLAQSYWAYVCDSTNGCSAAIAGSFTVQPAPVGVGATNPATSDTRGLEEWRPYRRWDAGANNEAFVNLANGNLVVQADDLAVAGQGLNLGLTRTYDSRRFNTDGPLGPGWALAITETPSSGWGRGSAIVADGQQLAFDDADGTRHTFAKGGSAGPGWHSPPGVNLVVTDDFDAAGQLWYKLTRPDGVHTEIRRLGGEYKVTRVADRKGNQLAFSYSGAQLHSVTDTVGRTIAFTWTSNAITKARYSAPGGTLEVDYGYDAGGRLATVTEAAGTAEARMTTYTNTQPFAGAPDTYLTAIADPRTATTAFTYNALLTGGGAVSAQVCTVVDRGDKTWTFTHNGICGAGTEVGTGAVTLTDPDQAQEVWTSVGGNLVAHRDAGEVDAAGVPRFNVRRYEWVNNRLRRQVDEAANVTDYDWNDLGQLQQSRLNGNGEAPLVTDLTYAPVSPGVADLTETRAAAFSAEQRLATFTYDPSGNGVVIASTDPMEKTTHYGYYARGLLRSVRDPRGHTTLFGDQVSADGGYHPSGQPTRVTDPTGAFATFTFDFLGRLTTRVDREGHTWTTGWDLRGNKTAETSPHDGETSRWCYDANDNAVLDISPRSPNPHCGLDGTDGHSTRRTFERRDLLDSVVTASDGQRRKSVYGYDNDGELASILEPRSFNPTTGAPLATEQRAIYHRFANNRVRSFVDEEGAATDVTYTPHGLPLRVVDPPSGGPERHSMTYAYTKLGLVRSAAETGHAGPTVYDYSAHGEQTVMAQPMGSATHNAYDANGRLVRTVNAQGRMSLRTYDDAGNLTSLSQPTGAGAQLVTTYTHTRRNEIDTESDPADGAHTIDYDYDGEGRQRLRRDLYNGALQRSTDQTWRADGRLTQRDARFVGTETRRHRSTWSYDAAGNPTAMATYADGATSPNVSSVTAAYTSANELKAWDETIYNAGVGITRSSVFAYDQNGLITRRTVDGRATAYTYDRRGQESSTHAFGAQAPFTSTYHPSGALATKALPNGAAWSLAYDLADRVTSRVLRSTAGAVLSGWENLTYDDNDSKLSEHYTQRQLDGTTTDGAGHYGYDKLNRLTTSKHPLEPLVMPYVLDDAGNVVTETGFVYTYTANRLTRRERFPQIEDYSTYDYDRFGNQTQEAVPGNVAATNTYDAASHTVTRNQGGFSISQAYDASDRMVRRSDSTGDVTLFFHDGPGQAIALETDGSGATKTTYTLDATGEALLSDDNAVAFPSGRAYYVTDGRGSLTQLLDGAGNVTAVFAYDDFGKQKDALTQTSPNGASTWDSRLRFQLAPKDGITGQYAIGPRMFDPGTYRFIGADQFVGAGANQELQTDPLTGNRYLYAGGNPANLIDDGHAPQCHECADFASGFFNGVVFNTGEPVERALGIHGNVRHGSGWRDAGDWASIVIPGGAVAKGAGRGWRAIKAAQKARKARKATKSARRAARGAAAACRSNSFIPATLVLMANGTTKRIADVQIGDMVMATDPETGERGPRRVTEVIVGDGIKELVDIEIGGDVLTATDGHPFWVDDEGRWVDAEDLDPGDVLLLADGNNVIVDGVRERTEVQRVHNLTVDGIHTYYVFAGDDPVLVHNCGSLDDLSRAARAADRNGLTAAGRAAQKHGNRPSSTFPLAPDRTARGYNEFGQALVDDLLTAPNTATRSYIHPSYGRVTEYIGPQYGARWGPNGQFIGFL